MFAFLKRLLGTPPAPSSSSARDFAALEQHAPLKESASARAAAEGPEPPLPMVCREAVLGQEQKVAGYQFMHHQGTLSRLHNRGRSIRHIYSEVLVRSLANFSVDRLLGHRLAFVDLPDSFLTHPSLNEINPRSLVAVLEAHADENDDPAGLPEVVAAMRARGIRIALKCDHLAPRHTALLPQADFLVFAQASGDPEVLARRVGALHAARPSAAVLVRNLNTFDDFHLFAKLGASHFQGAFVTSREPWHAHDLGPSTARLSDLLARLKRDADTRELAEALKRDGALSVRLLRYVNSAAVGLPEKINSFERALQLLGRDKLHRWLMLLMLSADANSPRSAAVLEGAMVRARMLELLGHDEPPEVREELFMTGLLSLIDVVLEMPMADALKSFAPTPSITAAIIDGQGRLADLLALARACEESDAQALDAAAERAGVTPAHAGRCHVEALAWALEVGE